MSGLPVPGPGEVLFVPLGGSGEIGMNLNLYGHDGRWLMVDCGVAFQDEELPQADVVMPDIEALEGSRGALEGIVLTHAHEDHHGAVHHLWPRLRCPVLATPFTAALLRGKLAEAGLGREVPLEEVEPGRRRDLGPFGVEYVSITHSIPEAHALAITTSAGTILHTGDWKLDPAPVLGRETDEARLRALGEQGVLAMTCDSTNALVEGESGSEGGIGEALAPFIAGCAGLVAVATFASNVARLRTIARAAAEAGREVGLVGRSLWRMTEAARATGYLEDVPPFLEERAIRARDPGRLLLICTGSQGEPRAALARIAAGAHRAVRLAEGDRVIFSSRVIPGNERAVRSLWNALAGLGVEVVTPDAGPIHVSGHPARDELARMYGWIRPRVALPVHGEALHIRAHADLARSLQVPEVVEPRNGAVIRVAPGPAGEVGSVPAGRLVLDGSEVVPHGAGHFADRRRMLFHGAVTVSLVLDGRNGLRAAPRVVLHGIPDPEGACARELSEEAEDAWDRLPDGGRGDGREARRAVGRAVRRASYGITGKRPSVAVDLVRLDPAP